MRQSHTAIAVPALMDGLEEHGAIQEVRCLTAGALDCIRGRHYDYNGTEIGCTGDEGYSSCTVAQAAAKKATSFPCFVECERIDESDDIEDKQEARQQPQKLKRIQNQIVMPFDNEFVSAADFRHLQIKRLQQSPFPDEGWELLGRKKEDGDDQM